MSTEIPSAPHEALKVETVQIPDNDPDSAQRFLLHTPDKVLNLEIAQYNDRPMLRAEVFVANRTEPGDWKTLWTRRRTPRVPGSTTALFREARSIMQNTADEKDLPVLVPFNTRFASMRRWALDPDKGAGLFNWSPASIIDKPEEGSLDAVASIMPQRGRLRSAA